MKEMIEINLSWQNLKENYKKGDVQSLSWVEMEPTKGLNWKILFLRSSSVKTYAQSKCFIFRCSYMNFVLLVQIELPK